MGEYNLKNIKKDIFMKKKTLSDEESMWKFNTLEGFNKEFKETLSLLINGNIESNPVDGIIIEHDASYRAMCECGHSGYINKQNIRNYTCSCGAKNFYSIYVYDTDEEDVLARTIFKSRESEGELEAYILTTNFIYNGLFELSIGIGGILKLNVSKDRFKLSEVDVYEPIFLNDGEVREIETDIDIVKDNNWIEDYSLDWGVCLSPCFKTESLYSEFTGLQLGDMLKETFEEMDIVYGNQSFDELILNIYMCTEYRDKLFESINKKLQFSMNEKLFNLMQKNFHLWSELEVVGPYQDIDCYIEKIHTILDIGDKFCDTAIEDLPILLGFFCNKDREDSLSYIIENIKAESIEKMNDTEVVLMENIYKKVKSNYKFKDLSHLDFIKYVIRYVKEEKIELENALIDIDNKLEYIDSFKGRFSSSLKREIEFNWTVSLNTAKIFKELSSCNTFDEAYKIIVNEK